MIYLLKSKTEGKSTYLRSLCNELKLKYKICGIISNRKDNIKYLYLVSSNEEHRHQLNNEIKCCDKIECKNRGECKCIDLEIEKYSEYDTVTVGIESF